MLTTKEEDLGSVKPIAKARPRQKPTVTLIFVFIFVFEREWIDLETQRSHDHKCYEGAKAITRLLRYNQSFEEAMERSTAVISSNFDDASQWLIEDWIYSDKRWRSEEKISILYDPNSSNRLLYLRAINSRTFRRERYWSYVARQCATTPRIYRVHQTQQYEVDWFQEGEAS